MVVAQEIDPNSYGTVDGTWQFDLQFYRDIGLDLSRLEDDTTEALMPRLRRAAGVMLTAMTSTLATERQKTRAERLLETTHGDVRETIYEIRQNARFDDVNTDHPAVADWQERNSKSENPSHRPLDELLGRINWIHLGLVRPRMPEIDPEYMTQPFRPVTRPNANFYSRPIEVVDQLVHVRAGVWFDI
jgi:hypothetical protein